MKTRLALGRDRHRAFSFSRGFSKDRLAFPRSRRLLLEPLEDRCLLSGVAQESALELFSLSPALFVENQGQWADESVRFLHQADGVNVEDADTAYLLITNEAIAAAFQPLADRRTDQGLSAEIVTVEYIDAHYDGTRPDGGSDLQTKIRNCIIDYWRNRGTQYVLLGGDDTVVPMRYCVPKSNGDPVPADLYYADADGGSWDANGDGVYGMAGEVTLADLTPELRLGRLPADTSQEVADYFDKVVTYETACPDGFANSMLLAQGGEPPGQRPSGNDRPEELRDHDPVGSGENYRIKYWTKFQPYWQAPRFGAFFGTYTSWDEEVCGDYPLNGANLAAKISEGYHFIAFSGHGNPVTWFLEYGERAFHPADALGLTNPIPSIVRSGGCSCAAFDEARTGANPSLSEAYLFNPHGGAVIFTGYCRSVSDGHSQTEYWRQVFEEGKRNIGQAFADMQTVMAPRYLNNPYHHYIYLLLGDPAITVMREESGRSFGIDAPDGCEVIDTDAPMTIRWSAAGTGFAPGEKVRLEYSNDSGATWRGIPGAEALDYNGRMFCWTNHGLPEGDRYRVRVVALADETAFGASRTDFSVRDLGLLTVDSDLISRVQIWGTHPNLTNYTFSVGRGDVVSLRAGDVPGYNFAGWLDSEGALLTHATTYSWVFQEDTHLLASYNVTSGKTDYYVNDDVAEEGFAAGYDANDGRSPQMPVRNIQEILDRYGDVRTIHVSSGFFGGKVQIGDKDPDVTIEGAADCSTVIDGGATERCIEAMSAGVVTLKNLTLQNGSSTSGGAVYCSATELVLQSLDVSMCAATGIGGGLYAVNSAVTLADCGFTDCRAVVGGGLYVSAGSITLNGCTFSECTASSTGAGAYLSQSQEVAIRDCQWTGNSAGQDGGAAYFNKCGTLVLSGSRFESNSASRNGGAVFLSYSSGTVVDATFADNEGANGGGMYLGYDSRVTVQGAIFTRNSASTGHGGGLYLDSNASTIRGNCFAENTALAGRGGGIHANWAPCLIEGNVLVGNAAAQGAAIDSWAANLTVVNNTVYEDPAHPLANPSVSLLYADYSGWSFCNNIVWAGPGFDCVAANDADAVRAYYSNFSDGYGAGANGNLSVAPGFADASDPLGPDGAFGTPDDGLRLAAGSACIDAGHSAFRDGDATRSDMGAYGQALPPLSLSTVYVDAANAAGPWDGSAVHPYLRIWEALYAAPGATVHIGAGTYTEAVAVRSNGVCLLGQDGESTVIDAQYAGTAVQIYQSENVEVSGLKLTHGYGRYGGGLQVFRSSVDLHDCNVLDNKAMRLGGGIYVANASSANIAHNRIEGNAFGNWIPQYGAGVFVGSQCYAELTDNTILRNRERSTHGGGGGLYFVGSGIISRNYLLGNYAGAQGGGMYLGGPDLTVTDNVLVGNRAPKGGGIYLATSFAGCLSQQTLASNAAVEQGGAVFSDSTSATLDGCILWANSSPSDPQLALGSAGAVTIRYSDVEGGWSGEGNLEADPLLVRPPDDGGDGWGTDDNDDYGDLHLRTDSPCIDAGDPDADCFGRLDIDGHRRLVGYRVDIGADEYSAVVTARHIFYNNSYYDNPTNNPAFSDDTVIATDKEPLLPGREASFENYTTYSRGINGVMVDIAGLGGTLTSDDFEFRFGNDNDPDGWVAVTAMPTIDVRPGEGIAGSDRVTLIWDDNTIPTRNWLQVRVKATESTGLAQDEVFYFGNAIGDADGDRVAACADMYAIYQQLGQPATVDNPLDIDRDGFITTADMDAVFPEVARLPVLYLITVPSVVATADRAATDTATVTVTVSGVDELEGGRGMEPLAVEAGGDGPAGDGVLVEAPVANRANGSSPSPEGTGWIPAEAAAFFPVAQRPIDVPKDSGHQVQQWPGPRPFDHGPAPLPMSLDAGQDAGRGNKARAHDAVMEEAAKRESLETWLANWGWLWWYDFEQMRMKKRSSKKDTTVARAADEFLASWRA